MQIQQIAPVDTGVPFSLFQTEIIGFAALADTVTDYSDVEVVFTPLFGAGFDAFDLINHLGKAGYKGRLRVLSSKHLPDPALVLEELHAVSTPFGIVVELRTCPSTGLR